MNIFSLVRFLSDDTFREKEIIVNIKRIRNKQIGSHFKKMYFDKVSLFKKCFTLVQTFPFEKFNDVVNIIIEIDDEYNRFINEKEKLKLTLKNISPFINHHKLCVDIRYSVMQFL